jgi:nucleotide-binding universal stress UspA family protein
MLKSLEEVVPADPAVAYEHHVVMGDPATEIIQLARSEGADLIVMGTHGRTGLTRLMMGSVAEAVVRRAPCPVLTLKHALASNGPPSGAREVDLANIGGGI